MMKLFNRIETNKKKRKENAYHMILKEIRDDLQMWWEENYRAVTLEWCIF